MDPYKCVHCRARRSRGICEACTRLGVKWRDVDTMKITYGSTTARRYVYASLAVDPGKEDGPYTSARGVLLWSWAAEQVRRALASLHIPPARQEGPRRV